MGILSKVKSVVSAAKKVVSNVSGPKIKAVAAQVVKKAAGVPKAAVKTTKAAIVSKTPTKTLNAAKKVAKTNSATSLAKAVAKVSVKKAVGKAATKAVGGGIAKAVTKSVAKRAGKALLGEIPFASAAMEGIGLVTDIKSAVGVSKIGQIKSTGVSYPTLAGYRKKKKARVINVSAANRAITRIKRVRKTLQKIESHLPKKKGSTTFIKGKR